MSADLKITYVQVSDLIEYDNNPRINDHAVEQMAALIDTHTFAIPILYRVTDEGMFLIDGHLRIKAARYLDMESVPGIDVSHMDEDQITAFRVSVNRAAELAEWDFSKLGEELANITAVYEDDALPALTGFDDEMLSALMDEQPVAAPAEPEARPDVPKTKSADKAKVKSGTDTVDLKVSMTADDRDSVLAKLDEVCNEQGFSERSTALLHMINNYKAPARRKGRTKAKA